jgi:phosphoribosylcarboxyaminoimidazole (NCAIR) mutase
MSEAPQVAIVMGSDSDWPVMQAAAGALDEFEIPPHTGCRWRWWSSAPVPSDEA